MPKAQNSSDERRFYYAGDEKIYLSEATDLQAVRLQGKAETPARAARLAASPRREDGGEEIGLHGITVFRSAPTARGSAAAARPAPAEPVAESFPVFRTAEMDAESALILTHQLVVQFKPEVTDTAARALLEQHQLKVVSKDQIAPNNYICTAPSSEAALDAANKLHLRNEVEYAQPDFVRLTPKTAAPGAALAAAPAQAPEPMAPDTFIGSQWGLHKIRAPQAWGITRGSASIKVAVIDEGTDMTHEDLMANLLGGYDSVDNDNNQQPNPRDGHGTACAGIVAAVADNGRGVAGVAPLCKLIPVRIAVGTPSGGWATSDTIIARGVRTAVDRGADVLSNSWGGGPASAVIRAAFQYARTNGRGGKGSIAACASGNNNSATVSYPARYPECFAVGASNQWDQRKSTTSADGENWWGSQYGPELQVVAPGVQVYTTDMMGANGYTGSNYVPNFNGTSSATPHVAGTAGLILSVDSNLTVQEVEEILRRTAVDIAPAGRDNQTGFGRIDAFRAVIAAKRVWHDVAVTPQFYGAGRECFMRINLRIYNSGINRVRIDNFVLRSYTADWSTVVDEINYVPNPGGIMEPFANQDLRVNNILMRANGNYSSWTYRWALSYNYTFWRPTLPASALAQAGGEALRIRAQSKFSDKGESDATSVRFEAQGHGQSVASPGAAEEAPDGTREVLSDAGITIEKQGNRILIKL